MDQVITYALEKGISWTIVVILLLYIIKRLYDDKEAIQEKRIAENQKAIETISQMTVALNSVRDVLNAKREGA